METECSKPHKKEEPSGLIAKTVQSICVNSSLALANPASVKSDCDKLRILIKTEVSHSVFVDFSPLYPLIQKRSRDIAEHVFSLLTENADLAADYDLLSRALISARDKHLGQKGLEKALQFAQSGKLDVNRPFIHFLASHFIGDKNYFSDKKIVHQLGLLINCYQQEHLPLSSDIVSSLFAEDENLDIRRLAATMLDNTIGPPSPGLIEKTLGKKNTTFFLPYLIYTRASHEDLLCFNQSKIPRLKEDFINVRNIIGDKILNKVISKIGWERINSGIKAEVLISISIGNSPPFMFSESEAIFAEKCIGAKRIAKQYLIYTFGGQSEEEISGTNENDPINRFRSYNLNHASLLTDFLDINPLSIEKVEDMIRRMDMITEDYVALFSHISDECSILPAVYKKIRDRITAELKKHKEKPQLSADLTRIVQSFEEPKSIGTVRTLHGLKRYLHQHGLSMGFKLALNGRSPNRTVDIIVASEESLKFTYGKIRFVDFEPQKKKGQLKASIPYTVELLLDGFARQMLNGQQKFPNVDIFCYGNEVHYYFGFKNHPAFLRIDYAPPLRGGMIDLEYYGVSNYELDQHPNISLDAIKRFFQSIEFEIQINTVRIHARYDKERALTLGDLCEKAQKIFQLAPYFMDVDWIIGSLDLSQKAKQKVTEAWIEFFHRWGYLPVNALLTKDRTGILCAPEFSPSRRSENKWSGEGKYTDIYSGTPHLEFFQNLIKVFRDQGLDLPVPDAKENKIHHGQLDIEKRILIPLKSAIERGELIQSEKGLQLQSEDLYHRVHESEIFAKLLSEDPDTIAESIRTARLVRPLERTIKFTASGDINGYAVQKAVLVLRGEEITFFILRGAKDMIRLAFFIHDQQLYNKRSSKSASWVSNANYNSTDLADLLKENDFIDTLPKINRALDRQKALTFLEEITQSVLPASKTPMRGDRIVTGLKASPGYTVGKALFETQGRNPQDFKGAILIASSIGPEDTGYLYYASGVISTGGGILSHAGLIAMEFRKPALIVSGKWQTDSDGRKIINFKSLEYKVIHKKIRGFRIAVRTDIRKKEYTLREGDLVILDAYAGTIRLLGQDTNICSLHEGFIIYRSSAAMLAVIKDEREILSLRGKLLRARHMLENVMQRCNDPVAARYAVFEILLNEHLTGIGISTRDKKILLSGLLNNKFTGEDAREYLMQIPENLQNELAEAMHKAETDIPTSENVFEILYLRLDILHKIQALESASVATEEWNISTVDKYDHGLNSIEKLVSDRFLFIKKKLLTKIRFYSKNQLKDLRLRHLLRQLERFNSILSVGKKYSVTLEELKSRLFFHDNEKLKKFAYSLIIDSCECGFELYNYIGWKAANLAEIDRLSQKNLVPAWFAVTDFAFQKMMLSPVKEQETAGEKYYKASVPLREAITEILNRDELNNRRKSAEIRNLWERIILPDDLCKAVKDAYKLITGRSSKSEKSAVSEFDYVAVRSSSLEEDTEAAAHAGEFETYLYIRGEEQLLYYLKQTWSGLWTERAIHSRALQGGEKNLKGGGVIVQRMVNSRVSGVLQTVNIPKGNIREMVINVGLGLGEGIVSGVVTADQVTVTKGTDPEKELLRFSYITSDKTKQIVFNRQAGFGTVSAQTVYHQRLRPAMEYIELCELVRNAASLEKSYGYPLDIEFGIEEDHLWILQARPVASFLSVLNETGEKLPLNQGKSCTEKI